MLLIGLLPLFAVSETIRLSYRETVIQQRMSELKYTCNMAAGLMEGDSVGASLTDEVKKELNWIADYVGGRILIVDDSYRFVFDTFDIFGGRYCTSEEIVRTFWGENYSAYISKTQYLEFSLPLSTRRQLSVMDDTINGVMIVSASASWVTQTIDTMTKQVRLLEIAGCMILTALAFLFSYISNAPWNKVLLTLRQILEGDLNVTFEAEDGYNETRQIIETFNKILERLRVLDASRQEFVSNVSHELKTPITSIRVLADSLISEENVPVDIYREFMSDISEEIDRETKIINDLLALVRLDKSTSEVNITPVNINGLIEQTLKRVRPIAKKRSIEIIFESFRPVTAEIDETKFGLVITNLVENGVKYNNDGGWVRVSLNADHKYFFIRVADSGVGIPEDEKDKIFERFYRVDKARSRETGGTGLGLAITKSVILLHRGAIRVDSKPGEGTVFTVRIPLKYLP
ncbi:MAG: two-component sensor histidine kinase [Lachnospiraceae bacterium]|nr:two-component sensor histidine kinase [Lachnospiraceae bacterium]